MGSTTLSIIAPILPYQMKEKNIPEEYSGVIFCVFAVAGFLTSQVCGRYLSIFGGKAFIYGGLILFCLSHYQFSLLEYVSNPLLFVSAAIFARICEGISYAVIQSTTYGVSSQELPPKEFDRYARLNSAASGIGCSLSLCLGPLLFLIGGYMFPYFILGSVFILLAAIIYITGAFEENSKPKKQTNFDNSIHKARLSCNPIDVESSNNESLIELSSVSTKEIKAANHAYAFSLPLRKLRIKGTIGMSCLSIVISNICTTYLDPIMAMKLYEYGILADTSGYIFIFFVISYSCFGFMGGIINKYVGKRNLILAGFMIGCLAFVLIGHQIILGKGCLTLIMLGLFLNGLSVVFHNMFATIIKNTVKERLMEKADQHRIDKNTVGGYFGGLKSSCSLLGFFLGPLISAFLYLRIGFDLTCISLAVFQFLFFFLFCAKTSERSQSLKQNIELLEI